MTRANDISIAELKKDIEYIKTAVDSGFSGVHQRQDLANGKLQKHESRLTAIEENMQTKNACTKIHENDLRKDIDSKGKIIWFIIGTLVSILVTIITTWALKRGV